MFTGMTTSGPYMQVLGGPSTGYFPYVPNNSGNSIVGMMRYSSNMGVEVYDGAAWKQLCAPSTQVGLTNTAIEALNWVQNKMGEEAYIMRRAKESVAVADAWDKYNKASDELKVVLALTEPCQELPK